jgi:hypothetical protein
MLARFTRTARAIEVNRPYLRIEVLIRADSQRVQAFQRLRIGFA